MPEFLKKHPLAIITVVSVLLIALIIVTSINPGAMTKVEGFIGQIVTPAQKFMYTMTTRVVNFFIELQERRELESRYAEQKALIAEMEKQLMRLEELEKENQRLKRLLEFSNETEELVLTGARVIGKNPGSWFNVFLIDKGEDHGLSVNMAVINDRGLVGRIIEVGPNWSKVRSIVDGQSSVSAIIERTRDNGQVEGNNNISMEDGTCRMIYLSLESDIVPGDRVITSGLEEIFPKGIYIGEVISVERNKRDLFKTALIQPAVDFRRLEEVLVVRTVRNSNEKK